MLFWPWRAEGQAQGLTLQPRGLCDFLFSLLLSYQAVPFSSSALRSYRSMEGQAISNLPPTLVPRPRPNN